MHVVLVAESFIKVIINYLDVSQCFFFSILPSGHLTHDSGEDEVLPLHIRESQVLLQIIILQLFYSIQKLSTLNI